MVLLSVASDGPKRKGTPLRFSRRLVNPLRDHRLAAAVDLRDCRADVPGFRGSDPGALTPGVVQHLERGVPLAFQPRNVFPFDAHHTRLDVDVERMFV